YDSAVHRYLHSFPTRRSSDLGRGVFIIASEAARDANIDLKGARVCVQGFGNVGGTAGSLLHDAGAHVIAVQDHTGTIYNANGLRSEEHTSELQSRFDLVCRLL